VGQHYSVEALDARPEHLLPEVGPGVNDHVSAFVRDKQRTPKPLVTWVIGGANFTVASNNGDALGGAGAEEGESQLISDLRLRISD
jgi:hypothetical protein